MSTCSFSLSPEVEWELDTKVCIKDLYAHPFTAWPLFTVELGTDSITEIKENICIMFTIRDVFHL